MIKPLALVCYSNLLPGSQIANRLYELGYRVQVVAPGSLDQIVEVAEKERPLLLLVEIAANGQISDGITAMKANAATQHIPVLAYASKPNKNLQAAAKKAGASLLADSQGILDQLPQLLDMVLQVE